ncbi:ATP synthase subunit a [Striga asiatica]|uniref:ATP synthase subunit a n=1 Tax=Striga asiatica TaxID=4170 RepID=A0A5A7Q9X4_STRAF|nr:ATP synthase subunit a [Striga asiatica]
MPNSICRLPPPHLRGCALSIASRTSFADFRVSSAAPFAITVVDRVFAAASIAREKGILTTRERLRYTASTASLTALLCASTASAGLERHQAVEAQRRVVNDAVEAVYRKLSRVVSRPFSRAMDAAANTRSTTVVAKGVADDTLKSAKLVRKAMARAEAAVAGGRADEVAVVAANQSDDYSQLACAKSTTLEQGSDFLTLLMFKGRE